MGLTLMLTWLLQNKKDKRFRHFFHKNVLKPRTGKHSLAKNDFTKKAQITLLSQVLPYMEGKATYVIAKPCQLISGTSVTCKNLKRRGVGSFFFPSHLYSGWQIEASLGAGWKLYAAGWWSQSLNRWGSALCTWNAQRVDITQMVRKLRSG